MRWLAITGGSAALLAALWGCGDPLESPTFAGEPLAVLEGIARQPAGALRIPADARLALFWRLDDGTWQQTATPAITPAEGSTWRFPVYETPPMQARGAGYAIGRVLPFIDADDDGWRSPGEPLHAVVDESVVLWSPDGLDAATGPVTLPIAQGFRVVFGHLPRGGPFAVGDEICSDDFGARCGTPEPQFADDPDAGVWCVTPPNQRPGDTGPCPRDETTIDCGGDLSCVAVTNGSARLPLCVSRGDGCAPMGARRVPDRSRFDGRLTWQWEPGCTDDADCGATLRCSRASGTCVLASRLGQVGVTGEPSEPSVCPVPADDEGLGR